MIREEAEAIIDLTRRIVTDEQLVSIAGEVSSRIAPLGVIRNADGARNALVSLAMETANLALDEARRRAGWVPSANYPFELRPPPSA